MGAIRFMSMRLLEAVVVIVLITFMPNIPPKANFSSFNVTPANELQDKLAINYKLNGVEHYLEGQLIGPEAFAEYNGELYTTVRSGDVIKIFKGHIVPIVKFGKPCTDTTEESICGRPLGLKFDKHGIMYVIDAYMGLWKYNINTGKKTQLVSMNQEIEGKKSMLPNSIAVSENGDIYWSDSSSDFLLEDGIFTGLADGSGRLIHYNAKTKTNKVLLDKLYFANGVHLSDDESFVLVAETFRSRINRYYLKGPKAGTHDIFVDGLPGLPDNINSDGQGGFFFPLYASRDTDNPNLFQVLTPFPLIRKFLARVLALTELAFKTIDNIYPNIYAKIAIHKIGHFETIQFLLPKRITFLHYSKDGNLINSYHSNDKSMQSLSEVFIYGDNILLGSPHNPFIGRIPLSKLKLEHLKKKTSYSKPASINEQTISTMKVPTKQEAAAPPPTKPTKKTTTSKQRSPLKSDQVKPTTESIPPKHITTIPPPTDPVKKASSKPAAAKISEKEIPKVIPVKEKK